MDKEFSIMDRQRLIVWQREFYEQLDSVKRLLLPADAEPAKGDSRAAQASPVAATAERLQSNPPILKSKSLWVQSPRPTRVHSRVTRARRGRMKGKRSRGRFRLSLAAPLRRTASLMPFRRPPAAFRRQRQTEA